MKFILAACLICSFLFNGVGGFIPSSLSRPSFVASQPSVGRAAQTSLHAKYKNMDEILALFPSDKPVLVNFYDASQEEKLRKDITQAKSRLKDRATLCSIKQQDYPELSKLWDANVKSPSMILFRDKKPVLRFYEVSNAVDILTKVGKFC